MENSLWWRCIAQSIILESCRAVSERGTIGENYRIAQFHSTCCKNRRPLHPFNPNKPRTPWQWKVPGAVALSGHLGVLDSSLSFETSFACDMYIAILLDTLTPPRKVKLIFDTMQWPWMSHMARHLFGYWVPVCMNTREHSMWTPLQTHYLLTYIKCINLHTYIPTYSSLNMIIFAFFVLLTNPAFYWQTLRNIGKFPIWNNTLPTADTRSFL